MATSSIDNMKDPTKVQLLQPTWKELKHANRMLAVPFKLALTDNDIPLLCEEVVRVLPGKRMVVFATWGETAVVVKLFYELGQAKRHLQREVEGLNELKEVNIPSPRLLWQGSAQKNKIQILIFERIIGGYNLDDIWRSQSPLQAPGNNSIIRLPTRNRFAWTTQGVNANTSFSWENPSIKEPMASREVNLKFNSEELLPLMKAVTIELATQHVLGIVQSDLHLKNFFITNKHIYTLDAGSVESSLEILPREESLNHLALFFAQLGVGTEDLQDQLFQVYAQARGWLIKKSDIKYLRQSIAKWNEKRWERFKKKIYRNSSIFACKNRFTDRAIYDQTYYSEDLIAFLKNPDSFFHNTLLLKEGRSSTVAKIKLSNRFFVVKRYNIKSFWHGLRRCLRPTRASKSWRVSQQLYLFGIPTAKPVGFIEKRFLGFRGRSYFIMEYIEGPHIGEYFADKSYSEDFPSVAEKVVALLGNLFKLRLTHGDLKMTNILIQKNQPFLIDLDGVIEHRSKLNLKAAYRKTIKRFMRNWEFTPTIKALFEKLF